MKITRTLIAALSASALAAPAFAGSAAPAAMEPMIEAPAPAPMAMGRDWTGGYAGVQLGYADVSTNIAGVEGDDMIGGLTAGYDWDLGNYVLGVGLDADIADLAVAPTLTLERVYRLKVRGGYDLGNGLIYATAGGVGADVDGLGYDTGYFIGAGYEHMLTDSISLGGEVLYHEFDNFQDTADVEATTFQVRANYRF
ncbi:outer membrane protein [Seohaeicola saemankumensis]|uniref:Outer membrane protein n=1 Tax=Seohaeicola saemankumensis TaxID=481181 RepID=A0ABW3TDL6_9RHOB